MTSTRPPTQRFSWDEARRYWEGHALKRAPVDYAQDPNALDNVCHPGAPRQVNEYYARFQRRVYEQLLAAVPNPLEGLRALDVGCGAGRWCRLLHSRGWETTGIDLQQELIERNRVAHPDIKFERVPLQDYRPAERFDLVSSVTVLQHLPFEQQPKAAQRLRELLNPGGHALLLENVRDQDPHVFSNSIAEWRALMENAGFRLVQLRRYDYSPALRLRRRIIRQVRSGRKGGGTADETPDAFMVPAGEGRQSRLRRFAGSLNAAAHVATALADVPVETRLIERQPTLPSIHCGFLFAVADPR